MLCSDRGCAAVQITHSPTQSERGALETEWWWCIRFESWGLWSDAICCSFVSFRHSGTIIVGLFVNNIYQKQQACGLSVVLNVVQTEINPS